MGTKMTTKDKRKELIRLAEEKGVKVDAWGNIKYQLESGKWIRYAFKKTVIRIEYKMPSSGSRWVRINSTNISHVNLDQWDRFLDKVIDHQKES